MSEDITPTWARLVISGQIEDVEHPFAGQPTVGMIFHARGSAHDFVVASVEPDPDSPDRFIVHAERTAR